MTHLDDDSGASSRDQKTKTDTPVYDAIVVGSGACGSFAAKELTAQGLSVLLLEAGREITAGEFDPRKKPKNRSPINIMERALAAAKGQPIQSRSLFFQGLLSAFYVNDRDNPYTTPNDAPYVWIRGRQAGGRTHIFGRVLLRWTDDDFKLKTRTGQGEDWPITYDEIEPYYDEVEGSLGLYGNSDAVSTLPDGNYKGPAKLSPAEDHFKVAVEKRWPGRRVVAWRSAAPDPARIFPPLRDAKQSGRLKIVYNAIARRIVTEGDRATAVEVVDAASGAVSRYNAHHIILCASPIETIRLMLLSASPEHRNGLGNSSDNLGRHFMDQIPMFALGTYPPAKVGWSGDDSQPADPFYDPSGGVFIPRFEAVDDAGPRSEFAWQGVVGRNPVGDGEAAQVLFMCYGQMLPHADNRITLDRSKVDRWGIPVPHIRCKMHSDEDVLLSQMEADFIETMTTVGGEVEFLGTPRGFREWGRGAFAQAGRLSRFLFRRFFKRVMVMGASIHESGGARIGSSRENSVLNQWGQCWDVPNLYVTDASAFPGSGVSGTTLTAMALTVRACRHLANNFNKN